MLAVILGQRALSMIIEIEQGTLTIATATCAGLKGAVDEAKIMFSFKVNHRGKYDHGEKSCVHFQGFGDLVLH